MTRTQHVCLTELNFWSLRAHTLYFSCLWTNTVGRILLEKLKPPTGGSNWWRCPSESLSFKKGGRWQASWFAPRRQRQGTARVSGQPGQHRTPCLRPPLSLSLPSPKQSGKEGWQEPGGEWEIEEQNGQNKTQSHRYEQFETRSAAASWTREDYWRAPLVVFTRAMGSFRIPQRLSRAPAPRPLEKYAPSTAEPGKRFTFPGRGANKHKQTKPTGIKQERNTCLRISAHGTTSRGRSSDAS